MIEEASESGELTPLVLLVIRNRLELARHDVKSPSYYLLLCWPVIVCVVHERLAVKKNPKH